MCLYIYIHTYMAPLRRRLLSRSKVFIFRCITKYMYNYICVTIYV